MDGGENWTSDLFLILKTQNSIVHFSFHSETYTQLPVFWLFNKNGFWIVICWAIKVVT